MRHPLHCVTLMCLCTLPVSADERIDSLLLCLDEAIVNSNAYVTEREARINDLSSALVPAVQARRRLQLYESLYDEYKSYQNDSAIAYLDRSIALARAMGLDSLSRRYTMLMAYQCSLSGMYAEAFTFLRDIQPSLLSPDEMGDYYIAYNHLHGEMAYYTQVPSLREGYRSVADSIYNSMSAVLPSDHELFTQRTILRLLANDKFDEAHLVSSRWVDRTDPFDRDFAIVAFYRFLVYKMQGDREQAKLWVIRSTLSDVRHAVMDQGAMWELVNMLMDDGDLSRAYRYMTFSWECAEHFGTRMRSWQISPTLSRIDKEYQHLLSRTNHQLITLLVITGVLALMFLGLLVYVLRQRNKLAVARHNLSLKNKQLEDMNNQLSDVNTQLSELNVQLSSVNMQLSDANGHLNDSNRLKEVYIGHFLRLCSTYIGKMDGLRRQVGKLAKNRDFDQLYRLTRDTDFSEQELEALYDNFDKAFLRLFPDFVSEFNALLREEYSMHLDDKNQLNTTLRIFALIRLGIEDSSKIAEFLRYSVNTIYNYRARTKGWAVTDRDNFEEQVKAIGTRVSFM